MKFKNARFSFMVSKRVFDIYLIDYNKDKKSCDRLKAVHAEVFYELLMLFGKTIKAKNGNPFAPPIDSNKLPHVFTSNIIIADRRKRSATTVYRAIMRLIEAKVLNKINHGSIRDVEFVLNPQLIAIYDGDIESFSPKLYRTEFKTIESSKTTKCKLLYVSLKDTTNNKEMPNNLLIVDKVIPIVIKTKWKPINGNTPEHTKPLTAGGQNISLYDQKMKDVQRKTDELKLKYATYIVDLYIAMMLVGKNIFLGERWKAIEYVQYLYFNTNNTMQIRSLGKEYEERLKMAFGYSQTKGEKYAAPFPRRYFDKNNLKNGFGRTKVWLNKGKEYKQIKEIKVKIKAKENRQRMSDEEKLQKVLKAYNAKPDINNYIKQRTYIKNNIPNMMDSFLSNLTIMNE